MIIINIFGSIVVKALRNALRERHKYGATSGICRAALLNDNAPDSELSVTGSSTLGEQQLLISTV